MLKGNLVVGKTQSVVVRADSLTDLIRLAETKGCGSLRVSIAHGEAWFENLPASDGKTSPEQPQNSRSPTSGNI